MTEKQNIAKVVKTTNLNENSSVKSRSPRKVAKPARQSAFNYFNQLYEKENKRHHISLYQRADG